MRNRFEEAEYRAIAERFGLQESEVRRAVRSFFFAIFLQARKLPFNNHRRIYTKEKFDEYISVVNIPYIGRIGPVYSRYLAWRGNEAKSQEQVNRGLYRERVSQDEIEHIADEILSGKTPSFEIKKKNKNYTRIWVVGKTGKKMARQVLPKE